MHEEYELLLNLTPEEMATQILAKRRLLADQISIIIPDLEESVERLQKEYDEIFPQYREIDNQKGRENSQIISNFKTIREKLRNEKKSLEAAIRISKESDSAVAYWTKRVNGGVGELDSEHPDLLRFSKAVRSGEKSRAGIKKMQKK